MKIKADWVGRQSSAGSDGEEVPIQIKMFNCEEIVLASMLSVLE